MKKYFLYLPIVIGISFNSFSQIKGMGMKLDNKAYEETPLIEKPLGFGANLPKSMSLKEYCPEVGDQGQHGTCTAWSSTYYGATMEYAIQNNIKNKSLITTYAFDPYFIYLNLLSSEELDDASCAYGTYLGDACERLVENGAKRVILDPFDCNSFANSKYYAENNCVIDYTNYVRLFSMTYDWNGNSTHVDEFDVVITSVCQSLVDKHPVLIGMDIIESFGNIGSNGLFNSKKGGQESIGGHAMTVVGYDDNKHGGCFTVVNSWGNQWGENGFLYITYEDFYKYVWYAFILESEMKTMTNSGCQYGDCNSDYGIMKHNTKKMKGVSEGYFSHGKMTRGIYTNMSGDISKKELKTITKSVKGNYMANLLYDNSGNIIGYSIK